MKTLKFVLTVSTTICLLLPTLGTSQQIISGGLSSIGNNNVVAQPLLLMHAAISDVYDLAKKYYETNHVCAPAGKLLNTFGNGNSIHHITNKADCSIEATFRYNTPSALQGGTLRMVPDCTSSSSCDFSRQLSVTDIDSSGRSPSMFQRPRPNFSWSPSFQAAGLNIPSALTADTKNDSYDEISNYSAAANSTSGGSNAPTSTRSSNINTI